MQRNEIEQIANDILRQFRITNAPFTFIKEICDHEQIVIKRTNFSFSMDGGFWASDNFKVLFYNPNMPVARQNFTKAHELGHYYLKHYLCEENMISCSNLSSDGNTTVSVPHIETEANYFATYFLMPQHMVQKEYQIITGVWGIDTTRKLYVDRQPDNLKRWNMVYNHFKNRFGVSQAALGYRLDSLGLICYKM